MRKALDDGDYRALLQNTDVMRLLADPNALKALDDAASAAEVAGASSKRDGRASQPWHSRGEKRYQLDARVDHARES